MTEKKVEEFKKYIHDIILPYPKQQQYDQKSKQQQYDQKSLRKWWFLPNYILSLSTDTRPAWSVYLNVVVSPTLERSIELRVSTLYSTYITH